MKAKPKIFDKTSDMFRSELNSILDLRHELCQLSKQIDWDFLDAEFGKLFPSEKGCPATATSATRHGRPKAEASSLR